MSRTLFHFGKGGTTALDPGDDGEEKHAQRASWGVCTELPFEGFVHFLRLCEERVLFPKGKRWAHEPCVRGGARC